MDSSQACEVTLTYQPNINKVDMAQPSKDTTLHQSLKQHLFLGFFLNLTFE